MRIETKTDFSNIKNIFEKTSNVNILLSQQVLSDSNYFIPKDEGILEQSSKIHSNFEKGELVWKTPYARRLYWNPQFNFSKDVNPHASGLWFEVAKAKNIDSWIELVKKGLGV